jgi:hypothetical protein
VGLNSGDLQNSLQQTTLMGIDTRYLGGQNKSNSSESQLASKSLAEAIPDLNQTAEQSSILPSSVWLHPGGIDESNQHRLVVYPQGWAQSMSNDETEIFLKDLPWLQPGF